MESVLRRERHRLSWVPVWEGLIEGWARKFIRQHQWRCDSIHSFDDLLNDSYLIYRKIYDRYPRVIDPPHFMSLFQKAMWNSLNDHSRYTRRKRLINDEIADYNYAVNYSAFLDFNSGPLLSRLTELPEEVQQALILLQTQPELLRQPENGPRENLNAKLWRILGLGEQKTARGRIRSRLQTDFTGQLLALLA